MTSIEEEAVSVLEAEEVSSESGVLNEEKDAVEEGDVVADVVSSENATECSKRRKSSKQGSFRTRGRSSKSSVQVASVVKLFVKKVHACQTGPWKMSSESSCTGSGFILSNKRIVTNAHVVHRGQSILCRAQSGGSAPKKWECAIESISLPLDLAVLRVVDEEFFRDKPALQLVEAGFENLPHLDDNVTAVGFPTGGDQISVTRGVVSRITHIGDILRVQIDAAINPGNSGGPVFNETGKVVGVAAAHLKDASNIGYIIPACVVHLFFMSTKDTDSKCNAAARSDTNPQGYCGIACLGINTVQTLENATLRNYLGLQNTDGGVRVVSVDPLGGCIDPQTSKNKVQPDDVLLTVNDIPIGQDGTVQLPGRPQERIHFTAIVTMHLPTTPIKISLIRNKQLLTHHIYPKPRLFMCPRIDGYDAQHPPHYLICGGCVFTTLTRPWLKAKKKYDILLSYYGGPLTQPGRQIVILSTVLASSINVGYHNLGSLVLRAFHQTEVFSLQHLADLIQNSNDPLLEFRLALKAPTSNSIKTKQSHLSIETPTTQNATVKEELIEEDDEGTKQSHLSIETPTTQNATVKEELIEEDDEGTPREDEILVILDREKSKQMDPIIRKSHMIAAPCSPQIEFDW